LQLVSPRPEPQRWLPSEKREHTSPALQSLSVEQRSHSWPLLPHEPIGSTRSTSNPHARQRFLIALSGSAGFEGF
jgi:hypothetical protein